ncbi:hypothetical protein VTJ83DRAFT_6729 [Remersonia thermophila]|uniref:Rhodopsin domain-containing protein n=1 Tax=Remersonia thermophila TaxID=72144 RepID=A0ABR4D5J9_9PEZI
MADTQTPAAPRWRGVGFPNHGADDQGWKLYITSLVMIISAGLFVVARVATRLVRNNLGWDDWTIVFSLANSIVLSVAIQLAVSWGYGMHKADLTKAELETCLRWFFVAQTPYKVVVFLNKVSVVLLYMRIFVGTGFRIAAYSVLFVVFGYSVGGIAATIWQCVPIQGAWNKNVPARCINSNAFWVAYAVLNILTDVMVLALPVIPVMKLQLRWRERFLILGVFLLGAFVTITSILRVTSVQNSLKNRQDQTWSFIERGVWTLIESNLGIICACLPVLKQPLGKLFPRLFGSTIGGRSGRSASEGKYHRTDDSRGGHTDHSTPTLPKEPGSNPRFWRAPLKHELSVSVSANRDTVRRGSDEHHIFGRGSDTGSDNIELGDRSAAAEKGRISKTVELTRTSFHEARP